MRDDDQTSGELANVNDQSFQAINCLKKRKKSLIEKLLYYYLLFDTLILSVKFIDIVNGQSQECRVRPTSCCRSEDHIRNIPLMNTFNMTNSKTIHRVGEFGAEKFVKIASHVLLLIGGNLFQYANLQRETDDPT
ncbi:hypothetical protein T02_2853 [Trichinella nativa]|uniref:Uncharacterized protein n=1 Tax=Trichinella nativa TaxID=6335 RepID=A0A0V1LIT0_9BILA|nr:hypothetical protein T02_2853 [Trichinella nativa]